MVEQLEDNNFELTKKININEETIESLEHIKFALENKEPDPPDPSQFVKIAEFESQQQLAKARQDEIQAI